MTICKEKSTIRHILNLEGCMLSRFCFKVNIQRRSGLSRPLERYLAIATYHIDFPRGADNGPALRANILDAAILGLPPGDLAFAATFHHARCANRIVAKSLC